MALLRTFVWNAGRGSTRIVAARGARVGALAVVLGCSSDVPGPTPPPPPPTTGTIRLRATTIGSDVDPDGYIVRVTNTTTYRLGSNGSIEVPAAVGSYTLAVLDVAANCTVDREAIPVTISGPGETSVIDVRVACAALGILQVTAITTGTDVDLTGYRVAVDGLAFVPPHPDRFVPVNGTVTVRRLAPGRRNVWLQEVAANCGGSDLAPRQIDVVAGATVAITFNVTCTAPSWLAYAGMSSPPSNTDIYVVRSDRTNTTRLTDHPGRDEDPVWSPDGRRIAFTSERDGIRAIHVMNDDGSNVTRLTPTRAASYRPAWSPDGSRIAFVSERDDNVELYAMNADGTNTVRLTNHGEAIDRDPAWSPDGAKIAFSSDLNGRSNIYVLSADGSGLTRITADTAAADTHPAWSPDGSKLAFSRLRCFNGRWPNSCYQAVMIIAASGGSPIEVGIGDEPSWSPDGARIAATRFACDFYYNYGAPPCAVAGVGIVTPLVIGLSGYLETWEPELTKGTHSNPTWRP